FSSPQPSPPPARGRPARGAGQEGATAVSHVLPRDCALHRRGDPTPDRLRRSSPPLAGEGKSALHRILSRALRAAGPFSARPLSVAGHPADRGKGGRPWFSKLPRST